MSARPIPEGYAALTPVMNLKGCEKAITFFEKVFGAEVVEKHPDQNGNLMHVDMKIGGGHIMFGESIKDPVQNLHTYFYVTDCDAVMKRAIENGATEKRPVADMFYGDRMGTFIDPFGNHWTVATHKEDVSKEEMMKRMAAMAPPK